MQATTKKFTLIANVMLALSTLYVNAAIAADAPAANANDSSGALAKIAQNTTDILTKVNDIPNYINQVLQYVISMQSADNSPSTASMQSNFATVGKLMSDNVSLQLDAQPKMNLDLLGPDATKDSLPYANDLVYSTLLGKPVYVPDPRNKQGASPVNAPYNYIKNASGMNTPHLMTRLNWRGNPSDVNVYSAYYNTVLAVESFNGYVLSNQLAELQNNNALSAAQLALVKQASSSDWLAQIAAEEIGKVLRQLLMFESQTYVLMTQLLQTQKQLLSAQVMTNALIITTNQDNEATLLSKAESKR